MAISITPVVPEINGDVGKKKHRKSKHANKDIPKDEETNAAATPANVQDAPDSQQNQDPEKCMLYNVTPRSIIGVIELPE